MNIEETKNISIDENQDETLSYEEFGNFVKILENNSKESIQKIEQEIKNNKKEYIQMLLPVLGDMEDLGYTPKQIAMINSFIMETFFGIFNKTPTNEVINIMENSIALGEEYDICFRIFQTNQVKDIGKITRIRDPENKIGKDNIQEFLQIIKNSQQDDSYQESCMRNLDRFNPYNLTLDEIKKIATPENILMILNMKTNFLQLHTKAEEAKKISKEKNIDPKMYSAETIFLGDGLIKYYDEVFNESGAHELFAFLQKGPQYLNNLGGQKIKSIKIDISNNNSVHRFRGILHMIKSRPDIELPSGATPEEQDNQRKKICKEYENIIRYKISLDYDTNEQGEKVPKQKPYDAIFTHVATQDYSQYIENKNQTLYTIGGQDQNGAFQQSEFFKTILAKKTNKFQDYSDTYNENGVINEGAKKREMIKDLKTYTQSNPGKKVLVYIGHHGSEDGSSGPFTKKELIEISNISSDVKIIAETCNFGYMFDSDTEAEKKEKDTKFGDTDYIYNIQSEISGFANKHTAKSIWRDIYGLLEKGIGINESEIIIRQNYPLALAPMTQKMEYTNRNTGAKETKNIGIAAIQDNKENEYTTA